MFKNLYIFIGYFIVIILIIPSITVYFYKTKNILPNLNENEVVEVINNVEVIGNENNISYYEKSFEEESNILENYILGVVGAEMPISFEEEALKAQAVAARTYAYKRVGNTNNPINHKNIGQAYENVEQMKKKWGSNFQNYYDKLKKAVYSTKGEIMIYNNEPIEAVFHSTSAGITEVSENIWGKNLPYIKSVDSSFDEKAPDFLYTKKINKNDFINKISEKFPNIDKSQIIKSFQVLKRSDAGYVLEVDVCGQKLTGRDIRTMFNLRSTNFTVNKNDFIEFTTKGYGHGAGMSQYGANFMAQQGKTYVEILNHYYKGIQINKVY